MNIKYPVWQKQEVKNRIEDIVTYLQEIANSSDIDNQDQVDICLKNYLNDI